MRKTVAGLCEQLPGQISCRERHRRPCAGHPSPALNGTKPNAGLPFEREKPLAPDPSSRQLFANYLKAKQTIR